MPCHLCFHEVIIKHDLKQQAMSFCCVSAQPLMLSSGLGQLRMQVGRYHSGYVALFLDFPIGPLLAGWSLQCCTLNRPSLERAMEETGGREIKPEMYLNALHILTFVYYLLLTVWDKRGACTDWQTRGTRGRECMGYIASHNQRPLPGCTQAWLICCFIQSTQYLFQQLPTFKNSFHKYLLGLCLALFEKLRIHQGTKQTKLPS